MNRAKYSVSRESGKRRMVVAVFVALIALVVMSAVTADVWDRFDYPGHKRKLRVWVRGAGGIAGFDAAVDAAMKNWNGNSGNPPRDNNGNWELVPGTEAEHDVDVGGGKLDGAEGDTLGITHFNDNDGDGVAEGGSSVTIDNEEDWGPGADQWDLERIIKHELGHAQRMSDTKIAGDLMKGTHALGDHNVTPSGHDQDEAGASHINDGIIDILPPQFRKNVPTVCSIIDHGMNLPNALSVNVTPLDPSHLQINNVQWNPTMISAMFFAMPDSWHNEGFRIDVIYQNHTMRTFGGFVTTNPVDPPPNAFPHANAGPDVVSWIGHTFTLHGSGSYHDDPQYTDSLVPVWTWGSQPGLSGGGAMTQSLSMAVQQAGVYNFTLQVQDDFAQTSTDSVTVTVDPYPPAGTDCFDTTASLTLIDPVGQSHPISLSGNQSISRSAPVNVGGLSTIDTEMVALTLRGYDPGLGHVRVLSNSWGGYGSSPSLGKIKQRALGAYYPADSFFDVFVDIEIHDIPMHNITGCHLTALGGINGIPFPDGTIHRSTPGAPIPLLDQYGNPTGWSLSGFEEIRAAVPSPEPYTDCMDSTGQLVLRNRVTGGIEPVFVSGPTVVKRSAPYGGLDWTVDTEIVSMSLTGTGPTLGPVRIAPSNDLSSTGQVTPQTPGTDFPAQSFFDVFVEVELPSVTLHNCSPLRMEAVIPIPTPIGLIHHQTSGPVPLLDSDGQPTDWVIDSFTHQSGPHSIPGAITECYAVTGNIAYEHPVTGLSTAIMDGTIVTRRNPPGPSTGTMPIELVALSLMSTAPITDISHTDADLYRVSSGTILPQNTISQWPAASFFDIFVDLKLSDGKTVRSCESVPLRGDNLINGLPFSPGTVLSKAWLSPPVTTFDAGLPYGQINDMRLVIGDPCTEVSTPAEAKALPEGESIHLHGPVVSSFFDVFFYAEAPDRSSGVRVDWNGTMPPLSEMVSVAGTTGVAGGEARIDAALVEPIGPTDPILPLYVIARDLGGAEFGLQPAVGIGVGLNHVGELVRVSGWVSKRDEQAHRIWLSLYSGAIGSDDAEAICVDYHHSVGPIVPPRLGEYAAATGALGAEETPGGIRPVLYAVDFNSF